jgi:pimeloyl-ACP methyl ester carboxylesterase
MRKAILAAALTTAVALAAAAPAQPAETAAKRPTIVLVHGAFAESSSWNGVVTELLAKGYPVVAAANPLRGVKTDADYVSSVVKAIPGDVVLVGHSYGGEVISVAANGAANVKSLVYVAGYALDAGESAVKMSMRFPEGTLGATLAPPVPEPDGGKDLYIDQAKFRAQFAADVPEAEAAAMAATQRPVTEAALGEAVGPPAWKTLPSWFIYGERDKNIPRTAQAFMAKRAQAKEAVEVAGASHVVMISHPREVAAMIERAAAAR